MVDLTTEIPSTLNSPPNKSSLTDVVSAAPLKENITPIPSGGVDAVSYTHLTLPTKA